MAVALEPVKQDLIDNEILESVPKTMKAKEQLLLKKMKSSPDISWNEKGKLKYKGETVQGSNVVDLVNDVLRKRKCFNPQEWETFGETLRYEKQMFHKTWLVTRTAGDISVRRKEDRDLANDKSPSPIRPYSPKTPRNRRKEVQNWVGF